MVRRKTENKFTKENTKKKNKLIKKRPFSCYDKKFRGLNQTTNFLIQTTHHAKFLTQKNFYKNLSEIAEQLFIYNPISMNHMNVVSCSNSQQCG